MPCCGGLIASSKIHPLELKRATIIKLVHTISQSGKNADSILGFFCRIMLFPGKLRGGKPKKRSPPPHEACVCLHIPQMAWKKEGRRERGDEGTLSRKGVKTNPPKTLVFLPRSPKGKGEQGRVYEALTQKTGKKRLFSRIERTKDKGI